MKKIYILVLMALIGSGIYAHPFSASNQVTSPTIYTYEPINLSGILLKGVKCSLTPHGNFQYYLGQVNCSSQIYNGTNIIQEDDSWLMVIDENNLKVYLKVDVLQGGRFISYKFENSSDTEISFSWDVLKKKKVVQENNGKIILKPKSSQLFFDSTSSIQLKDHESLKDYSLILKLNE